MIAGSPAVPSPLMERNIKLIIAYDGTDFCGWQMQPGMRTVQGVLSDVAQRVLRHPISIRGSGRTDSGVHATGQVANLRTTHTMPAANMALAIGSRLPFDMSIVDASEVHGDFDAIRSSVSKLYRYRIFNTASRPVERHQLRYVYHYWHSLDTDLMRDAARHFVGEMDFSAMASSGCVRETMVRRVLRCDVHRHGDEVRVDVEGTGFLYNQVRNMTGTLIDIGRRRWPPDALIDMLASRDRRNAGPTAPPEGLCLRWVRYPAHLLRCERDWTIAEAPPA